jgi:hypothetical protein
MAKKKVYKLSDDAIAQVVKLLQLGILSGTDIADNFRTLEFVVENNKLYPSPDYLETLENNLQKLQDQVDTLSSNKPVGFNGLN